MYKGMKKLFCILLIISIFSPLSLFAGSKKDKNEVTLLSIDEAIRNNEYTEALELSAQYFEKHPEAFDKIKVRIDRIMRQKKNYNELEAQLIDLAANHPNEAEKNYRMVLQLEKMEKNPSILHQTIRGEVKNLTQFKACQERFNFIIESAMNDVAVRDFSGAANEFFKKEEGIESAFELYWNDFLAMNTDESVLAVVNNTLSEINANIAKYNSMQMDFQKACIQFITYVNQKNYQAAMEYLPSLKEKVLEFSGIRNAFLQSGIIFENLYYVLQKDNVAFTDASFLPFSSKFILGLSSEKTSGIIGALDSQWEYLLTEVKNRIYQAVLEYTENYSDQISSGTLFGNDVTYEASRKEIDEARQYALFGIEINSYNDYILDKEGNTKLAQYADYDESMNYIIKFCNTAVALFDNDDAVNQEKAKSAGYRRSSDIVQSLRSGDKEYISQLVDSANKFTEYAGKERATSEEAWLWEYYPASQNAVAANKAPVQETESAEQNESAEETSVQETVVVKKNYPWDQAVVSFYDFLKKSYEYADECASEMWVQVASYYNDIGLNLVADYSRRLEEAENLIPEAEDDEILPQNPKLCIEKTKEFMERIPKDAELLNVARLTLDNGKGYESSYAELKTKIDMSMRQLSGIENHTATLAERARKQYQNANFTKNEGDLRYSQAKNALKQGDFEETRRLILQARQKYSDSLALQNDERIREETDRNLVSLGEEIARAENEIVVREVRKYKNEARKSYYAGDFDNAETLIAQAETRWSLTNVEVDPELENLKALINTALSMKTGRVLLPSSPLYPEMSQILSIANQFYNEGVKLIKQKKKTQGTALLNQAQQKLNELKLVFPLNQEASILSLLIDQQLDAKSFKTNFDAKVAAAKTNVKNGNANLKQQAYSDLVDLYEVNPEYPGLKDLIYNVEIELGLRKRPVDNSAIVKANNLAKEAKQILASAGRDTNKIMNAKSKAMEALELNNENETAIAVLDEISLRTGGQATVVLSAADEELYQKAVLALQKNNIIAANTIVTQLLSKQSNKRSAKILELQKKVQSLL